MAKKQTETTNEEVKQERQPVPDFSQMWASNPFMEQQTKLWMQYWTSVLNSFWSHK